MRRRLQRVLSAAALALLAPGGFALAVEHEEGGLPQLRQIDTFASQIFWLAVTFAALYFLMSRVVLPRIGEVMEERQEKVDDDLARAERLKTEAEQVMSEYEAALTKARSEAGALIAEASEAMKAEAAARQSAFAKTLSEKTRAAESRIAEAKQAALGELASVAGETAVAITEKLIAVKPKAKVVEAAVDEAIGGRG